MNLKAVAHYLETLGVASVGSDLFITEMPAESQFGILLLNRYAGSMIDHELPGWRNTGFRMVVRSPDYEAGEQLAVQASRALTLRRDVDMGEPDYAITVRLMLPVNDPLPYRRSEAGVWEFEVDFECAYLVKAELAQQGMPA